MGRNTYTPRRASKRWLEGAPAYVLDILDQPQFADRYTVMLTGAFLYPQTGRTFANCRVPYLTMSDHPTHPQAVSMFGEMSAADAAAFRWRVKHRRKAWVDLPVEIRAHIVARCKPES